MQRVIHNNGRKKTAVKEKIAISRHPNKGADKDGSDEPSLQTVKNYASITG